MKRLLIVAAFLSTGLLVQAQVTRIPWHPNVAPPASGEAGSRVKPGKGAKKTKAPTPAESKYHLTFDSVRTLAPGVYLAEGNVRFSQQGMFLTADTVTYDSKGLRLTATGKVAVDFDDFTLSGSEFQYDLNTETGVMMNAFGVQKEGDFTVYGTEIRKIGTGWFQVIKGTFTSCNSAVQPWSITVTSAKFHVDHYAFLFNPIFKVRRMPFIYLPYLVWPIKPKRSTGLLIPTIGSSTSKGFTVNNALFLAPADWWDDTIYMDSYSTEGVGLGEEFRYVPSTSTYGWFHGYYIRQKSDHRRRWDFTWTHLQNLSKGWYFVGDINLLSDVNFPREYQRDYYKSTLSGTTSRVFLVRNWGSYSFTTKVERNLQYFAIDGDLVQKTLPGLELRSSLKPLPHGLYFGFQSSADRFHKEWAEYTTVPKKYSLDYNRFDLYPYVEWPLHPFLWLDVTPRLGARATYYGQSRNRTTGDYDEGSTMREYALFNLDLTGPRFFRKFDGGDKHVIEPYVKYSYVSKDDDSLRVPVFDENDRVSLDRNRVRYGVRNRVYSGDKGRLFLETDLFQDYSFKRDISFFNGDSSRNSPLSLLVRAWPREAWSGDLRLKYSTLSHSIESQALSLAYRPGRKITDDFIRFTYLKTKRMGAGRYNSGTSNPASENIGLASSFTLADEKITVNPYLKRDLAHGEWRNQRVILWYHGSCFSIGMEGGRRTIGGFRDTSYRFLVSLKGAGNVVDLYGGTPDY